MDLKVSKFCPRKDLSAGSKVFFAERHYEYTIECTVGSGANAIVYKATYPDNVGATHYVLLKECYPFGLNVQRNTDGRLLWEQADKETALKAFSEMYAKLMKFQNEDVGNSPSLAYDKFDQNNTSYIVFEYLVGAQTFETLGKEDLGLLDIVEVGIALTKVVNNYHQKGYLHLDIKPSNFLVLKETKQLVKLFDIDTVTPKENVKTVAITYSEGYAAPEQIMRARSKICEATDLFAIGAVLFEKITGRKVKSEDTSLFAHWDFDDEYLDNVNPCIKRMLTEVFRKTLAISVKHRYQTATELESALIQIRTVLQQKEPFVLSSFPHASNNFVGREKELAELEKLLQEKNFVFVHGDVGGIGKTELAKKYAELHSDEYDAIVFTKYKTNLEQLILSLKIFNCECATFEEKYSAVEKVLSHKVLLIVDNFDVDVNEDKLLPQIFALDAKIIFTTRTDFSKICPSNAVNYNIGALSREQLVALFESEADVTVTGENVDHLDKLLKLTNYHTLTTVLLAKHLEASACSLKTLYETLLAGIKNFSDIDVVQQLNDEIVALPIVDVLRIVFKLQNLSETDKELLVALFFLDFQKTSKAELSSYAPESACANWKNSLNRLIRRGWIQEEKTGADYAVSLHPIISQTLRAELQIDPKQNKIVDDVIKKTMPELFSDEKINKKDLNAAQQFDLGERGLYLSAFLHHLARNNFLCYVIDVLWQLAQKDLYDELSGSYTHQKHFFLQATYQNGDGNQYRYIDAIWEILLTCDKGKLPYQKQYYFDCLFISKLSGALETSVYLNQLNDEECRPTIEAYGLANIIKLCECFHHALELLNTDKIAHTDENLFNLCRPVINLVTPRFRVFRLIPECLMNVIETIQTFEPIWEKREIEWYWDIAYNTEKLSRLDKNKTLADQTLVERLTSALNWNQDPLSFDFSEQVETEEEEIFNLLQTEDFDKELIRKQLKSKDILDQSAEIAKLIDDAYSTAIFPGIISPKVTQKIWNNVLCIINFANQFIAQERPYVPTLSKKLTIYKIVCFAFLPEHQTSFHHEMSVALDLLEKTIQKKPSRSSDLLNFKTWTSKTRLGRVSRELQHTPRAILTMPYILKAMHLVSTGNCYEESFEQEDFDNRLFAWYDEIVATAKCIQPQNDEEATYCDKVFKKYSDYLNRFSSNLVEKIKPLQ